ncbi:MAG: DUF488 family protein [Hyphomicrobiaceae bacterium]|nr:DUF488 family protein [Hyphomicrobiaceae bacterium]
MHIAMKRIYDEPSRDDGIRILIDRLWPRGVSKSDAKVDVWAKDLAPTSELRKWYNHEQSKRSSFVRKYREELEEKETAVQELLSSVDKRKRLTLLTATKDINQSHAPILGEFLDRQ